MIPQLAGYKYAGHSFTWSSNTIYELQCTDNTTMKIAEQFVISLAASSVVTPDFECSSANTLPGEIPPRDPPIVNPVRAPYQDPNQETWLRVEDLLSRMPMREKMAQLMQGELERWVDFDTGKFNISGMKDHMFYHSGMLRGMILFSFDRACFQWTRLRAFYELQSVIP